MSGGRPPVSRDDVARLVEAADIPDTPYYLTVAYALIGAGRLRAPDGA